MNVTYRRPRRKSMLGTRLSILRDNVELTHEDMQPPPKINEPTPTVETKPIVEPRITRSSYQDIGLKRSSHQDTGVTKSSHQDTGVTKSSHQDTESFTQVLANIEILLQKNSQTLNTLLQEREELEKIERMLKDKINSAKDDSETCKENQPPNDNTPTIKKHVSTNLYNQNTPAKLFSIREGDRNDDEFVAPHNPAIDTMRSSIKFLKTPRQSRQTRKSIMLTPHSFSFSIHKQFESLKE